MRYLLIILSLVSFIFSQNYISRVENQLYDSNGNEVRLTGINWFGFETSLKIPHGLWIRDYLSMLQQIHNLGFNCIRLPWSNEIITSNVFVQVNTWGPDQYNGQQPMNEGLVDKTPMEALDIIINAAGEIGLKVILDNHSRAADGYLNEQLWYTDSFSEEEWISDWLFLAERYADNDVVIGFDLNNEPHGISSWGGNFSTDWKLAAENCAIAIQEINPNVLIIIEGVENYNGDGYWWGGNLIGAQENPIQITHMEKLIYSAHEYGPEVYPQSWFFEPDFPENMPFIWDNYFGYIMNENMGHILIGEFGIRDENSFDGISGEWFDTFLLYMSEDYSWTFWCINPNSGDTGGILQDDWVSVHQWKLDYLTPYMDDPIDNSGLILGDTNGDGQINIIDIVLLVSFILGNEIPNENEFVLCDMNGDGSLDVVDVVILVNVILGG